MSIPIIKFSIEQNKISENLGFFLSEDNYFLNESCKTIYSVHPDLKEQILKSDKYTSRKVIDAYVNVFLSKHRDALLTAKRILGKNWEKVCTKVFRELSVLLNSTWEGMDEIHCEIGVAPLYPRDLKTLSFEVYYKDHTFKSMAIILHEITHFLYFKKWHEMFPNDSDETFETPHPYWHLSEILAPLLNSENALVMAIPDAVTQPYGLYTSTPINDDDTALSIQGYFVQRYKEYRAENKPIEEYLRFARSAITDISSHKELNC